MTDDLRRRLVEKNEYFQERSIQQLRDTLSMLCHFIWFRRTRDGEHVWSIPVDFKRDFDCILHDAVDELEARRELDALLSSEAGQCDVTRGGRYCVREAGHVGPHLDGSSNVISVGVLPAPVEPPLERWIQRFEAWCRDDTENTTEMICEVLDEMREARTTLPVLEQCHEPLGYETVMSGLEWRCSLQKGHNGDHSYRPINRLDDVTKVHVEDALHDVFTRHGIASRSNYSIGLIGDLIRWAAQMCRQSMKGRS